MTLANSRPEDLRSAILLHTGVMLRLSDMLNSSNKKIRKAAMENILELVQYGMPLNILNILVDTESILFQIIFDQLSCRQTCFQSCLACLKSQILGSRAPSSSVTL